MNIKILYYIFFIFALFQESAFSDEININSSKMKILEEGNIITGVNVKADIPNKKIEIEGDKSVYDKKKKQLTVINNVKFIDKLKNFYLEGEKVIYNQLTDLVQTFGKTFIKIEDKYFIHSEDLFYDRKLQKIYTDKETTVTDDLQNAYNFEDNFIFDINTEIITSDRTNIIDINNNEYAFEKAKTDLKNNAIAGKELKVNFIDSYFGIPDNDPILKGRGVTSDKDKTKIYKATFTTCNTENKKCPPWELQTEEFVHDKKEKMFNYNNSWLKIFDKKILYFPYISHPDPTVKRKSGFLTPVYGSSDVYGRWVNIPYFKVINKEKDMTFNPRIYVDDKFIFQSEYRQAFLKSNLISDFSINNDGKNTNTHLFAKLTGNLSPKTEFSLKFQDVTNDQYLKIHNLKNSSTIIEDENELKDEFQTTKIIDNDTKLETNFTVYESLGASDHDRFQYILPNFTYTKNLTIPENYNGNFKFVSSGFQKIYETNKYESIMINDFLYSSNAIISKLGIVNNYDILIKNLNSYTENSTKYTEKEDYEVFGSLLYKTSFPLKKINEKSNDYLKPIMAIRYSPNNTKNISDKDLRLEYNNIFSFNRIGAREFVEGGKSLSLGIEYEKKKEIIDEDGIEVNKKIFGFNIANSLSDKNNDNLPSRSKLNKTRSDFVGNFFYSPNEILDFNYNFSYDKDFDGSNYDSISAEINVNNFLTEFNYTSEGGEIGNVEFISNRTKYNFNSEHSLQFKTSRDLKTDFTGYYNLMYSYETDCLIANLEFNKQYYRDETLVPYNSLLFTIRFIPFVDLKPTTLKSLVN